MNHEFPPLVRGLLKSIPCPEPAREILIRETHISWVLLSGEFAYKIKKPVQFGFVDFSSLEKRRYFCEEELRLNRRYSSDLYLDVVSVTGTYEEPKLEIGPVIEVALRMHQFDEDLLLTNLLATGQLTRPLLAELSQVIHQAHVAARVADQNDEWGSAQQILDPITENFAELRRESMSPARKAQLEQLEDWSLRTFEQLRQTFSVRKAKGHVRECHGDLHLGNIVVWRDRATPFDCLEFNPAFRWIDTMNEVAFVVMDLSRHGRPDLAAFFLNSYLEQSGDYSGVAVLRFYLVYRALVRAKVELLRLRQQKERTHEQAESALQNYLDLAMSSIQSGTGRLIITHGLSGSGKTWGTQDLIESLNAIRIRSDVERKRIAGVEPSASPDAASKGLYSSEMTKQTYDRLASVATELIQAGFPVIVDATFLRHADRLRFQNLARDLNVPFHIIPFEADEQVLRERIQQRALAGNDASDATVAVMEAQRASAEPLTDDEITRCVTVKELIRGQK